LLQANSIYDSELEGGICHMAPPCDSKVLQSVQSVGAKRLHLANGTFLHQENNDFSNGTYEFCYCLLKTLQFKFIFLQSKDTVKLNKFM